MVVEQAKSVAGAERDEVPLCVQSYRGDGRRGQALHQDNGLEAGGKAEGLSFGGQSVMSLPRKALPVLKEVNSRHVDHVIRRLVTKTHHQNLRGNRAGLIFPGTQ